MASLATQDDPGQYIIEPSDDPNVQIPQYDIDLLKQAFPNLDEIKLGDDRDPNTGVHNFKALVASGKDQNGKTQEDCIELGATLPVDSKDLIAKIQTHYTKVLNNAQLPPADELFDLGFDK